MLGLVDSDNTDTLDRNINLVDAARVLSQAPVRGEWLIAELKQDRAVHAVMTHQDDRVGGVAVDHETEGIRSPGSQILKRFPAWKPDKVRACKPGREKLRAILFHFDVASRLPSAVIDVVQIVQNRGANATDFDYGVSGLDASSHWAGVDCYRPPSGRDPPRHSLRLCNSPTGQRQISAAAEPRRRDAFYMSMTNQNDCRQISMPSSWPTAAMRFHADRRLMCGR